MQKKKYVCKFCGEVYDSGCALGGHISKVHRDVGEDYKRKCLIRDEKNVERERNQFFRFSEHFDKKKEKRDKKLADANRVKRAYRRKADKV